MAEDRTGAPDDRQAETGAAPAADAPVEAQQRASLSILGFHGERERQLFESESRTVASLYPVRAAHYRELALAPFRAVFRGKDLRVVGSKRPMYEEAINVEEIRRKIGDLKIVHIIRDPFDTVASSLTRRNLTQMGYDRWHIGDVIAAAHEWALGWHQLGARKRLERDRMLVLKYEDFATDFRGTTERLAAFLGVEPMFRDVFRPLPEELRRAALDPREVSYLEKMFGEISADWAATDAADLLERYPIVPLPYALGAGLTFAARGNGVPYLFAGFNDPEDWGTWSEGPRAIVPLKLERSGAMRLELRFRLFAREHKESAGFVLSVNGRPISRFASRYAGWGEVFEHAIEIPVDLVPDKLLVIEFVIVNFRGAVETSRDDPRLLGLGLEWLRVMPTAEAPPASADFDPRGLPLTPAEADAARRELLMDPLAQAARRRQLHAAAQPRE